MAELPRFRHCDFPPIIILSLVTKGCKQGIIYGIKTSLEASDPAGKIRLMLCVLIASLVDGIFLFYARDLYSFQAAVRACAFLP